MQSRLQPIDIKALPPAHRAIFQAQQTAFEQQQEANDELRARVELLTDTNRRLEHLISELRRAIYDKKSEKRPLDDRQLAFEDLEGAVAEAEEAAAAPGTSTTPSSAKRRAPRRNLGHLPRGLERIEHVIEPDSTQCPCGCGQMIRIGEDRTERLDIVPAQLRVIVTVRPKYACRTCEAGVIQAPAPAHLITGGLPTEGALAQVLDFQVRRSSSAVPSIADLRPLGRGVAPLHARRLGGQGVVSSDPGGGSTGLASEAVGAVVHGSRRARRCWTRGGARPRRGICGRWPATSAPGPVRTRPAWCSSTRLVAADGHAERFLEGFNGILQVDGYAGYNAVAAPGKGVNRAYCWAHCEAQAVRDPRQPPLGGRRAGIAPRSRRCTPSRSRSGASPPRCAWPCA